jgi:hypothetical protein
MKPMEEEGREENNSLYSRSNRNSVLGGRE